MYKYLNSEKIIWIVLGGIVLLTGLLIWLSPAEQSLGYGIKVVYLHVALVWSGMIGISLAGFLGSSIVITGHFKLQEWILKIGWVSIGLFAAGIGMSMLAAKMNWGGIDWKEPRMMATLNVLALAVIIQVVNNWSIWNRMKGILWIILTAFLVWSILFTPLVLHPRGPIRASSSLAIQLSFFGFFVLCFSAGICIVLIMNLQRAEN